MPSSIGSVEFSMIEIVRMQHEAALGLDRAALEHLHAARARGQLDQVGRRDHVELHQQVGEADVRGRLVDDDEACRTLGADVAINYKTEDFVAATKAATGGKGADVILDMVGGDYIERNYEAAAVEGRIVQIAFQGSPKATVDFRRIMLKRLTHTGSVLRSRPVADKGAIARGVEQHVLPLIAVGQGEAGHGLRPSRWRRPRRPMPAWRRAPISARSS